MTRRDGGRFRRGLPLGAIALLAVVPYLPTLRSWFLGDDLEGIWEAVRGDPWWTPVGHPGTNWRPIALASHAVNHALGGVDPIGYHVVNVGLHAINSVLVALLTSTIVRRLASQSSRDSPMMTARFAGFAAGALFAVAPNHTEAVSWISARGDLLMTCSALICLVIWTSDRAWRSRVVVAVPVLALGLMAKETVAVVPLALMGWELATTTRGGEVMARRLRSALLQTWPLVLTVAAFLVVRAFALGAPLAGYGTDGDWVDSLPHLVIRVIAAALRTLLPALPPGAWVAVAGVVVVAGVLAARAGIEMWRRHPATHAPAASLVAAAGLFALPAFGLGVQLTDTRGERLVYLPSTIGYLVVGVGLATWSVRSRSTAMVALAILTAMSMGALLLIDRTWGQAGTVAGRVARSACDELPRDVRADIIGLPDRLRGAYVSRNSFGAQLELSCGWGPDRTRTVEVATVALADPDDRLIVRAVGERRWSVRATGKTTFADLPTTDPSFRTPGITVTEQGRGEIQVAIARGVPLHHVWYVSAGRFYRLEPGG